MRKTKELKNINKNKTLKAIGEISKKNTEANRILLDIKKINETLDNAELICTKTDGTKYNFNTFAPPLKFVKIIYNYKINLDEAKEDQDKLEKLIIRLEKYNTKKGKRREKKS